MPGKVVLEDRVVQVSAGDSHTAALTEDGAVYLWGSFRVRQMPVITSSRPGGLPTWSSGPTVLYGLDQGCQTLVLEGRCPACFRCFPDPAHLIRMNQL